MNKQRRKQIDAVRIKLTEIREKIDAIRDEEIEAMENLPESLQASDKGIIMQQVADLLEESGDDLATIDDTLGAAYDKGTE